MLMVEDRFLFRLLELSADEINYTHRLISRLDFSFPYLGGILEMASYETLASMQAVYTVRGPSNCDGTEMEHEITPIVYRMGLVDLE